MIEGKKTSRKTEVRSDVSKNSFMKLVKILGVLSVLLSSASAELFLPSFFSDGMVLQRDGSAKVWGWTDAQEVTVVFGGTRLKASPAPDERWEVEFEGLKASGEGRSLTIVAGEDERVIENVVVGDVWLASGQSNMEWTVAKASGARNEVKEAVDPLLRVYVAGNYASPRVQSDFKGSWKETGPENTAEFTAVGYYFAKRLRRQVKVPIGVIECAWGGKPIESFISMEALMKIPEAGIALKSRARAIENFDFEAARKRNDVELSNYKEALTKWKRRKKGKKGKRPQKKPLLIDPRDDPWHAASIYQGMVAPLVGYGLKGVIWYQGESNAREGKSQHYGELLQGLVGDWRSRWQQEMPFYWVQLANFDTSSRKKKDQGDDWVTVQDEMRRAVGEISRGGMVVTNDIGNAKDIHPRNKRAVGDRLARWALAKEYGSSDLVYSGPLYRRHEVDGSAIWVYFDHAEDLKSRDGERLRQFEIQDEKGKWHRAYASIRGNRLRVTSREVTSPRAVRYAWKANPTGANLVNRAGLPASCFITR